MLLSNSDLKDRLQIANETKLRKWLNENRVYYWLDGQKKAVTTVREFENSKERPRDSEVSF